MVATLLSMVVCSMNNIVESLYLIMIERALFQKEFLKKHFWYNLEKFAIVLRRNLVQKLCKILEKKYIDKSAR
jgi:hypothetical protein